MFHCDNTPGEQLRRVYARNVKFYLQGRFMPMRKARQTLRSPLAGRDVYFYFYSMIIFYLMQYYYD